MKRPAAKTRRKTRMLTIRPAPLDRCQAILQFGPLRLRAALGRSGIASQKREGDGATPRATMPLLKAFHRVDRNVNARSAMPLKAIRDNMLWCDAPGHAAYNRMVRAPFAPSHETMTRVDHLYDICIVLDWNVSSRRRNAGSAIFFHLAKPGYPPTEGCVAIAPKDMCRLLPHLSRNTRLRVP